MGLLRWMCSCDTALCQIILDTCCRRFLGRDRPLVTYTEEPSESGTTMRCHLGVSWCFRVYLLFHCGILHLLYYASCIAISMV